MEFIIVFDPGTTAHGILEDSHNFIETYADYEAAKAVADEWKDNGDCEEYAIYARCSDERNYLV